MDRKALIISNPGEIGAENYCEGVNKDVRNYESFLQSPLGGFWDGSEIIKMNRPSKSSVKNEVTKLEGVDYSLIIFCGHGWYSESDESTIIELKKGEDLDSYELRKGSEKQTIILDSCRKKYKESVLAESMMKLADSLSSLDPTQCRRYYNQRINDCENSLIVTYACNIDETAGDSSTQGGYYSSSLIKAVKEWMKNKNIDLKSKYSIYSIVEAHNAACKLVERLSGDRQHPQIEKPRSDPYFPFAVMA